MNVGVVLWSMVLVINVVVVDVVVIVWFVSLRVMFFPLPVPLPFLVEL